MITHNRQNGPREIFLQFTDEEGWTTNDTTWCTEQINDFDVRYVRSDLVMLDQVGQGMSRMKRLQYFNHFVTRLVLDRGSRFGDVTVGKLRAHEGKIIADDLLWQDVIVRHDGVRRSPDEMRATDAATYEYCVGNFWGQVAAIVNGDRWG